MAIKYGKKRRKYTNLLYTLATAFLICAVFFSLVASFYNDAEEEAYEMLHIQTQQIKDDLILQLKSDRENLITMANFAAKLYADGESYNLMFDSFKPIGLFSNIGILNPDNTFVTKVGKIDLNGKISFEDEAARGEYISGRTPDLTRNGEEIIRSAVPIVSGGKTVGILYGVISLDTIGEKYNNMAKELDAQLFVYNKEDGKFVIDTINNPPSEFSQLKNRKYNDGYTYEALATTDRGYSSFKSIRTGEDLYIHYSILEDFNWGIMLARYEPQVFENAHATAKVLFLAFAAIIIIIVLYLCFVLYDERRRSAVSVKASGIRKLLLEINQQDENVLLALKNIQEFSGSRSAFFVDTDGEDYHFVLPGFADRLALPEDRKYFVGELLNYAVTLHNINNTTVGLMCITPNAHLIKTNEKLYRFLKEKKIDSIFMATITDKENHVSILGTLNAKRNKITRAILDDVAVCFSIAVYNKKHLNRTETAAVTDSLTSVFNRVSYKNDISVYDKEKPEEFSCIYIDVNELHLCNNKYGHAAGDAMLIYIANTLKEVFFGHKIYRMGGDEFLVFVKNTEQQEVRNKTEVFIEQLKPKKYNVAIGISFRKQNVNCEEMVREAELRMYEAKAQYYQNKENKSVSRSSDTSFIQAKTGIREIDTMLSVIKEHYNGVYRVSLDTDVVHRILMPSYLGYEENEKNFSKILSKYIGEDVHPDSRRAVMSFLNYDAIKRQIAEGVIPRVFYKKMNGDTVVLSVYNMDDDADNAKETLWVFAKD